MNFLGQMDRRECGTKVRAGFERFPHLQKDFIWALNGITAGKVIGNCFIPQFMHIHDLFFFFFYFSNKKNLFINLNFLIWLSSFSYPFYIYITAMYSSITCRGPLGGVAPIWLSNLYRMYSEFLFGVFSHPNKICDTFVFKYLKEKSLPHFTW